MTIMRSAVLHFALALLAGTAAHALAQESDLALGKRALTLEECVQSALRSNPGLLAAGEQREAARGRTQQVRSALLPQINGSASASHSDSPERKSLAGGVVFSAPASTYDETSVDLSVRQSIVNLSDWKSLSSAKANQDATDASFHGAQEEIVMAVARAYFGHLKAIHLKTAAEENLKVGEEQLKLAEKRREVGIGVEADILKARAQHAQDQLALINADKDVGITRAGLNHVMGIPLDSPTVVEDIASDEPVAPPPAPDVEAALAARPDIAEQRHRLRAAERSLGAAKALYVPDLGFDFGYSRLIDAKNTRMVRDSLGNEFEDVTEFDPYGSWRAGLSLNLAIFNGGAREGQIKAARADAAAARAEVLRLERDARLEIETAERNAAAAARAIEVSRDGVRAAEEDLRVTQGSYTQGILPILNLVQSQAALVDSRNAFVSATYDYRIALAELDRALGRGVAKYAE
jgi:outer membrane protein